MEEKRETSKFSERCIRSIISKMRKLKITGENRSKSKSHSYSYLPPEVQEMILERIDDEKALLRFRLVNWHWNKVANTLLEERQLARWKDFEPRNYNVSLCPTVRILDKNWKPDESYFVGCPQAMELSDGNPFPSNSLTILGITLYWNIYCSHDKYHPVIGGRNCIKRRVDGLLLRFGHYLTSFTLFNVEVSVIDLESTLRYMPNLKALTFAYMRHANASCRDAQIKRKESNVISQYLTHVKLKYCECSECVNWLIQSCYPQLISLEVYGCVGPYYHPRKFGKLKRLKICDLENEEVNKIVMEVDETLTLECLSIITVIDQSVDLEGIVDFINRFSSSLSYLHLDIDETVRMREPCCSDKLVELLQSGDVFPALKQLEISRMKGREWDEVKLKAVLGSRFPNLESVRVQTYRDWAEDLREVPVYDDCTIV